MNRWIAKCRNCKVVTSTLASRVNFADRELGALFLSPAGNWCIKCRCCGKNCKATPVQGKISEKHVCNDRCMSSTGTLCECSCGGKNHGAAFHA